ncbi:MAG: leucine-rich repeat protein [Oscillospiraceae bacterium]
MDFAAGFAAGFAYAKKLFGGGGGSADWTFPEHWLEIPDPEPNQVVMYVEADAGDVAPIIGLYGQNFDGGTIDYGDDGYTYEYPAGYGYNVYHVYQVSGQYIITITAPGGEVYLNASSTNVAFMVGQIIEGSFGAYNATDGQCQCIRAIKVGSNIKLDTGSIPIYSSCYGNNLVYLEFMGEIKNSEPKFQSFLTLKKIKFGSPPEIFGEATFQGCYALERADCLQNLKVIPEGMFSGCYALKSVDLPSAESESGSAFNTNCYSLQSANAPKLAEITANEFSSCYSLQKLTLADGCNINGNTFENCPQLFPKPQ